MAVQLIPNTISEKLLYMTTRIEVIEDDGIGSGTGFFFHKEIDGALLPLVITNKHVVRGATKGRFLIHCGSKDTPRTPLGKSITLEFGDFEQRWYNHPDDEVDLCGLPLAPIQSLANDMGVKLFYVALSQEEVWQDDRLTELSPIEEVRMVGYPIGMWDEVNNFPLIRTGNTATHPAVDYNGQSKFLVDMACFPGSSGSPVMIVNEGSYATPQGLQIGSSRGVFLGVLHAGPTMTAKGEIVPVDIPTKQRSEASTEIMVHLGYAIKAKEVLALADRIASIAQPNQQ